MSTGWGRSGSRSGASGVAGVGGGRRGAGFGGWNRSRRWRHGLGWDLLALTACGRCGSRALGDLRLEACARLRRPPEEEPDGMSRLVSLLYRLVFGCQLAEKWPKAGGRTWRMAVFVAEIEVETGPPVVIRALRRRHLSPLQPPLKGYPGFSGNLLHCNIFG